MSDRFAVPPMPPIAGDGESKQLLAAIYAGVIASRIDFACMSNAHLANVVSSIAKTACDLADALDAEFKKRGWSK
jgi:hypothetical protein